MYIEELEVGQQFKLEPVKVVEEDVINFAKKYDPQRIHMDPEYAKKGMFKGIIASGYQTIGLVWAKWIEAGILGDEIIAGTGVDKIRWLKPVYPNDTLIGEVEVKNIQPSSRGGRGRATFRFEIGNQRNESVTTFEIDVLLKAKV
ncbi:MaoC/PaaZ C-terminal domain-containing protein [Aquibacillus rhizosphaerae]|uniref:MaoC/PaaZ C-terminal domain-containing protein n=1 Tax=Aquibacillus rhizosphaerae TaxID=3051431 RepID=A0ABT7LCJ3_9BACI|nr:MaoC/PaaZ C-terminal domain-containing protein [Aquibacillus sp. LR5S19]MDL4843154.1 MaoC/PaaZ C-terminal domain-containing protein [Aquibacillus sp. LR5S19]